MKFLTFILALFIAQPVWAGASRDGGTDGWIYSATLTGPAQFTTAFWYRPRRVVQGSVFINVQFDVDGSDLGHGYSWGHGNAAFRGAWWYYDGAWRALPDSTKPPVDTWTHLALKYDGTNVTSYYNGAQENQFAEGAINWGSGDPEVKINSKTVAGANQEGGHYAYFQFFYRALSVDETVQIMHFPGSIANGLSIYWPIWGTDSPEIDLSGNGRTGTVTSTTEGVEGPPVFLSAGGH